MQAAQPLGATCRGGGHAGQAFGEGLAGTSRGRAAELPSLNMQRDWAALPGQVAKTPLILAMDTAGRCAAARAGRCGRPWLGDDGDVVRSGQDLHNGQARRDQRQQTLGQGRLSTQEERSSHVLTRPRNDDQLHAKCGRTQNSLSQPAKSLIVSEPANA